jgi:hypothetical protein
MSEPPSADWWFGAILVLLAALGLFICFIWAIALTLAGLIKLVTWPFRRHEPRHRKPRPWRL